MSALTDIVLPWLEAEDNDGLTELMEQVDWLGQKLFRDYEPNLYETFDSRFRQWMGNLDNEPDQKVLFKLLRHLFFVGRREFESLCRASFNGALKRWLIDLHHIPIDARDIDDQLKVVTERTWFCPITDSMRINAYLKLNHLEGHQFRPDWRSLRQFSDPYKIQQFVARKNLQQLVLMEDFVGGGTQSAPAIRFAAETLPQTPILVAPLICCPEGAKLGRKIEQEIETVTFSPVLEIGRELLASREPVAEEPPEFSAARELTQRVYQRFTAENQTIPHGYDNTGAMVVMYSNCPDNTLPVLHNESEHWKALFPRIRRK